MTQSVTTNILDNIFIITLLHRSIVQLVITASNNSNDDTDKTPVIENREDDNYADNKTDENYAGAALMNEESHYDQGDDYQWLHNNTKI